MEQKKLTRQERSFCRWFAQTGNGREAALRAGYHENPGETALRLRQRKEIQTEIERCGKTGGFYREAVAGLRRLAFGSGADALRLTEEGIRPEELDLYNVSEIKIPKAGGLEIKFFDRQRALEKLAELAETKENAATPFYQALERSGKIVSTAQWEDADFHAV